MDVAGEENLGGRRTISVILPCYNGEETLRVQLEALARQSWQDDWELVFVDNGSTDGSIAMVEEYRDRFPHLQVVHAHEPGTPRKGAVHSYRVGLDAATGDAFVLCEADDEVGEGWLVAMAAALETEPFVMCRVDVHRLNPPEILWPEGEAPPETGPLRYPVAPFWEYNFGGTLGFTRATYETLGPFDEKFSVGLDMEYCFRAHAAGIPITPVPDAVMHYRLRSSRRATFRQRRAWGREYPRVGVVYGASWGRMPRVRAVRKLGRELAKGLPVMATVALRRPDGQRALYEWCAEVGFSLGGLEGMPRGTGLRKTSESPSFGGHLGA